MQSQLFLSAYENCRNAVIITVWSIVFSYNERAAATLCQKMYFQRNFVPNEFRKLESTRFPLLRRIK